MQDYFLHKSAITRGVFVALLIGWQAIAGGQQKPEPDPTAETTETQVPDANSRLQESMISYSQGVAALKESNTDLAITLLKDAITLKPDEETYRYGLAMAYEQAGKPLNQWFQLRQAVLIKPDYEEAIQALTAMWEVALNQGAVDIGKSSADVKAALGEPDTQKAQGANSTWQYAFMGVNFDQDKVISVIDFRGIEQYKPPAEIVEIEFDERPWQLKQHQIGVSSNKREYAPTAQQDRKEIFTVERLIGLKQQMDAQQLVTSMHDNLKRQFPDVEWNILKDDKTGILVEWKLEDGKRKSQHELVRLLTGKQDIHRLAYTADTIGDRDAWIERLNSATLDSAGGQ